MQFDRSIAASAQLDGLRWNDNGLLPVIIQDANTGEVLTLAHANREALEETVRTKTTVLFSRGRNALWRKGETSGNTQIIESVSYDCDGDALLYRVIPSGPACHTCATSCFHNVIPSEPRNSIPDIAPRGSFTRAVAHLQTVLEQRKSAAPEGSYVAKLYTKGVDGICKKIAEESGEVIIAAKNGDRKEVVWEASDLFFHLLVLLSHLNVTSDEVGAELLSRR